MKPKYIPRTNEEPRKEDKALIAKTLLTFSDEPLHIDTISELTDIPKEAVYGIIWRMSKTTTKWPNIRRVADGTYMWDTNMRTRNTTNKGNRKARKVQKVQKVQTKPTTPVVTQVTPNITAPTPSTWEGVGEVDGKHILKHADGTLWIASRLGV